MLSRYIEDEILDSPYDDCCYSSLSEITSQEWESAVDSADQLIAWAAKGEWLPESIVDALEGLDYGMRLGKSLQIAAIRRSQLEGV